MAFFGGLKLWLPKDDSVWVHDLFDEMNIHDVQHDNVCISPLPSIYVSLASILTDSVDLVLY
jgi:hypothetical protein